MLNYILIIISVIVAAITLYFILRDKPDQNKQTDMYPYKPSVPSIPSHIQSDTSILSLHDLNGSIVTASSYQDNYVPEKVRINNDSYWKPEQNEAQPWIQFTLPKSYEISLIYIKWDENFDLSAVGFSFAKDDSLDWYIGLLSIIAEGKTDYYREFEPGTQAKVIRLDNISGIDKRITTGLAVTNSIPLKVGIYGRELK